jgi:IclR family acetate operon transcriptional repressor
VAQAPERLESVDRVVAVLRACASEKRGRSVRELAAALDLSKSAVHRLLFSLEQVGYLRRDPVSGRFSPGEGLLELTAAYPRQSDLLGPTRGPLNDLWKEVGETVCLHMAVQWKRMTIFQYESGHDLRFVSSIGALYPLHAGAAGRALLSLFDRREVEQFLIDSSPAVLADGTEVDNKLLLDSIAKVRAEGYAVSRGERVQGAVGVAAPIVVEGRPPMCVSVYGPEQRLQPEIVVEIVEAVKRTARECSDALGGVITVEEKM